MERSEIRDSRDAGPGLRFAPSGLQPLNDRYSRNTLTCHTRESGYPVRRGFAILSLALWNTGRPVKPGDDGLRTCGDLPVGRFVDRVVESFLSDFPKNICSL